MAIGDCDRARGLGAVGFAPARQQPVRCVAGGVAEAERLAVLRHAAQHGVDQAGIARRAPVGLGEAHRQIDRGVVGHLEPQNLHRADQQDGFRARRVGGESLLEKSAQQVAQGPQPPQRSGGEPAHQRAVAVGERSDAGMGAFAGELLVERDAPPQHAVKKVDGNPAGGEAGDFRLRGGARTRHGPDHCHELCPGREVAREKCH